MRAPSRCCRGVPPRRAACARAASRFCSRPHPPPPAPASTSRRRCRPSATSLGTIGVARRAVDQHRNQRVGGITVGPIRHRKRGYILTTDPSDAGRMVIFARRTNQTQEAWVYSHDGPIRHRKR
eukprot:157697-Prorocentrum_minimum.AAC.1